MGGASTEARTNNKKLPIDIWALGFVSLLMDTSSELVHGILPVFLVSVLGASLTSVGLLEGVSEATTLVFKVFSGPLSDWIGRRKPLVVLGYAMGAVSKPLFALVDTFFLVFGARLFDRMGKGIRGAPRDALVADLVTPELRGRAFGLRQSLDTVGAFLGPVLAIILMYVTQQNYRLVFWFATVPGTIAVAVLVFGVHERESASSSHNAKRIHWGTLWEFPPSFWLVVAAGALFQLARFSEAFLILRARDFGLGLALAPLVLIIMNVVYSLCAYPLGLLSDKIRREWFLVAGLIVLSLSELVLAMSGSLYTALFGVALWGLQLGMTQGTLGALVADTCLPEMRGTAYGIFNLFSAVALLLASTIAGVLWDSLGPQATFFAGASLSLISLFAFLFTRPLWSRR